MARQTENPALVAFTLGLSNQGVEDLFQILKAHQIQVVVDVRSHPVSRFVPHFNKKNLEQSLLQAGLEYLFMGQTLGGRPHDPRVLDEKGDVVPDKWVRTSGFQGGMRELARKVRTSRAALVCSEEDPLKCHRFLILTPELEKRGVEVIHLRRDGRRQSTEDVNEARPPAQAPLF